MHTRWRYMHKKRGLAIANLMIVPLVSVWTPELSSHVSCHTDIQNVWLSVWWQKRKEKTHIFTTLHAYEMGERKKYERLSIQPVWQNHLQLSVMEWILRQPLFAATVFWSIVLIFVPRFCQFLFHSPGFALFSLSLRSGNSSPFPDGTGCWRELFFYTKFHTPHTFIHRVGISNGSSKRDSSVRLRVCLRVCVWSFIYFMLERDLIYF